MEPKSFQKDRLLRYGYFPKELPFGFTTEDLANKISSLPNPTVKKCPESATSIHSFSKFGLNRRNLGIVNPYPFLGSVNLVVENWETLEKILSSSISLTKPTFLSFEDKEKSAFESRSELRVDRRLKVRATSRFMLEADISRFFSSIYTHSIAWAIDGKVQGKKNRKCEGFGNELDCWIRKSQCGQSMGIPIGNDISVIISEMILARVDSDPKFERFISKISRWVDDYEICTSSYQDAEQALSALVSALREYELEINDRKTRIVQMPYPLEDQWLPTLRRFEIRSDRHQKRDIIAFFDLAFAYQKEDVSRHALKFAVGRLLHDEKIDGSSWLTLQHLLMHSIIYDPGVIPLVSVLLKRYLAYGEFKLDEQTVEEGYNLQLIYSLENHHHSETAWCIWAITNIGLKIKKEVYSKFSALSDAISTILLLNAQEQGSTGPILNLKHMSSRVKGEPANQSEKSQYLGVNGEMWLLCHEARMHHWEKEIGFEMNGSLSNEFFEKLFENRVSFFKHTKGLEDLEEEIESIERKILGYRQAFEIHKVNQ